MFPGYVLIHMVMNDDTWYVVRNTRGVTGFVGPGSKPVLLQREKLKHLVFPLQEMLRLTSQKATVSLSQAVFGKILWALFRVLTKQNRL